MKYVFLVLLVLYSHCGLVLSCTNAPLWIFSDAEDLRLLFQQVEGQFSFLAS